MSYQVLVYQLCFNFSLVLIAAKRLFLQIGAKKGAAEMRACFLVLIYFLAPFIFVINSA